MATGFVKYDFENRQIFLSSIERAAKKVSDLRFPMGEIARDFYESEKVIFNLKSPGGFPDFKNEKSRRQKIREVGFQYPLLKRSGRLERSITQKGAPGNITILGKQSVVVGTKIKYGGFLQEGTKFMEARRFVFVGPESRVFAGRDRQNRGGRLTRWTNILEVFVERVLEAQGIQAEHT